MPRRPAALVALVALFAAVAVAVAVVVAGGPAAASAARDNSLGGTVRCDLDTGLVHADWRYTNVQGPAQIVDVSVSPTQWTPQITSQVPLGETVIARITFPMEVEQVTLSFTVVGEGWSDSRSSPVATSVCPATQVELSYSHQCDTSLVVTMRNKPYAKRNAELTIVPAVPAGAALGPFFVAPGQQQSVTVPLPTTYVRVFEGSTAIGGNSGPRPVPCAPPPAGGAPTAGPQVAPVANASTPPGSTISPTSSTSSASRTAASTAPHSPRPTTIPVASTAGAGLGLWWLWAGGAVVVLVVAVGYLLHRRARARVAPPLE